MSIRTYFYQTLHVTLLMGLPLCLLAAVGWAIVQWYFIPQLPPAESLKDIHLQVPLQVYTKDGYFIAEYGEERRFPIAVSKIPKLLVKAVLAAEDDRFYEHQGVDMKGLFRAAFVFLKTGEKRQGGSTITMQVARNFFLTRQKTTKRKFREILLALKIEDELSKDEILELYLNKIYFGHRAYGVGAAAQIYYGEEVEKLTLAQIAMLAGLPKAPSTNNPFSNKNRAKQRRNYVLERMLMLKYINQEQYETAIKAPLTAKPHKPLPDSDTLYIAEMVRSFLLEKFGEEETYSNGYRVYTTIESKLQKQATKALRKNLYRYDRAHGFKGVYAHISEKDKANRKVKEKQLEKSAAAELERQKNILVEENHRKRKKKERELERTSQKVLKQKKKESVDQWAYEILDRYPILGDLVPSLVLKTNYRSIEAYNRLAGRFKIKWRDISWARRYIHDHRRGRYPRSARNVVKNGDIIMVRPLNKSKKSDKKEQKTVYQESDQQSSQQKFKDVRWRLSQVPEIEGALVALDPKDGAIQALVGGFDFYKSKFNRVTQAKRQPGSTFKPFIYSAALAKGYSTSSSINDAPIVKKVGSKRWRPQNYSHKYYGWTTLRKALAYSHNVSAVRLLDKVRVSYAIKHLTQFGFEEKDIPRNLTIALGTGEVTPLELTTGFAVFANSGFRIEPYFIDHIKDVEGKVIFSANPRKICRKCPKDILEYSKEQTSDFLVSNEDCSQIPRYAPRAISSSNAYAMTKMLRDVIRIGTARKARILRRKKLAGKTGTTNNQRDAWFAGYSSNLVATVWMGFDKPRSLGYRVTGGNTALPMWIDFMGAALKGKSAIDLPESYGYIAQQKANTRQAQTYSRNSRKSSKSNSIKRRKNSRNSSNRNRNRPKENITKPNSIKKKRSSPKPAVVPDQLF